MNSNAKSFFGWGTFIFAILSLLLVWVTYEQETVGGATASPTEPCSETPAPTEEPVKIVFEDGVPTAVAFTHTPSVTPPATPTNTPTIAPTPTEVPPTPTEKPVQPTATPKPTKTPTPSVTTVSRQNKAYPTGCPRTVKCESGHTWKPYARHTAITNKSSMQYKLLQLENTASNGLRVVTDPNGVERYCIALAPQWAGGTAKDIGRCIDVYMKNGSVLHCVLADIKKPEHTEGGKGYYGSHGEITEWIAEQNKLPEKVRKSGDVSCIGKEWEGDTEKIVVLDYYIKGFGG